jgi:iron complex transport system ATP-binding protein
MSTIRAAGLGVRLGERAVLHAIDAELSTGWTAVVGPNGAGKSTLLRALAGLLPGTTGSVEIDGMPLAALAAQQRARKIAWLSQLSPADADLTVRETVALGRLPHVGLFGAMRPEDDAAVDDALTRMACRDWQDRRLPQLSGGERQRVLLARALATQAPILLLDEPTTHLDPPHQVSLIRLLRELAGNCVVVSVLHDLSLALHADQLLLLDAGRVQAHGSSRSPLLHHALAAVFGGSIQVDDTQAVPRIQLVHALHAPHQDASP